MAYIVREEGLGGGTVDLKRFKVGPTDKCPEGYKKMTYGSKSSGVTWECVPLRVPGSVNATNPPEAPTVSSEWKPPVPLTTGQPTKMPWGLIAAAVAVGLFLYMRSRRTA